MQREKVGVWKEKQEVRVKAAIDSAKTLFFERGIDAVKMTDIAEMAGMGVASLYRYPATATKTRIVIQVGCQVWNELLEEYRAVFEGKEFQNANGITQIEMILKLYVHLFENHRDFLRFVSIFDAYCLESHIPAEELEEYEKSVFGFFPYYEAACKKGKEDGTIRDDFALYETYNTVNHAMISVLKKLAFESILPQDSMSGLNEIELLIHIFSHYLRK